jgi:hypothetical protein
MAQPHEQFLNITANHSLRRISMRCGERAGFETTTYTYQELGPDHQVVGIWEVEEAVDDRPPHAELWRARRTDLPVGSGGDWFTDADHLVG